MHLICKSYTKVTEGFVQQYIRRNIPFGHTPLIIIRYLSLLDLVSWTEIPHLRITHLSLRIDFLENFVCSVASPKI